MVTAGGTTSIAHQGGYRLTDGWFASRAAHKLQDGFEQDIVGDDWEWVMGEAIKFCCGSSIVIKGDCWAQVEVCSL